MYGFCNCLAPHSIWISSIQCGTRSSLAMTTFFHTATDCFCQLLDHFSPDSTLIFMFFPLVCSLWIILSLFLCVCFFLLFSPFCFVCSVSTLFRLFPFNSSILVFVSYFIAFPINFNNIYLFFGFRVSNSFFLSSWPKEIFLLKLKNWWSIPLHNCFPMKSCIRTVQIITDNNNFS